MASWLLGPTEQSETSSSEDIEGRPWPNEIRDLWNHAPLVSIHPVFGRNDVVTGLYITAEVVAVMWLGFLTFRMPLWFVEALAFMSIGYAGARFVLFVFTLGACMSIALCIVSLHHLRHPDLQTFLKYVYPFITDGDRSRLQQRSVAGTLGGFFVALLAPGLAFWLAKVPHYQMMIVLVCLPQAIPFIGADSGALFVKIITLLCKCRAESFCTRLKEAMDSQPPGCEDDGFWERQGKCHHAMDKKFENIWGKVSVEMVLILISQASGAVLAAGIALMQQSISATIVACLVCLVFAVGAMLNLRPVAEVTSLCQSLAPGKLSIRSATNEFITVDMDARARQEWFIFSAYLDRTPTGVELPIVGVVSYAFIAAKIGILVTLGPPALAIMKRLLAVE